MDAKAPDKGVVDDGGRRKPKLLHFIDQLHGVSNIASSAEMVHQESVGRRVRGGSGGDHQLHDANGLPDLVGLAEIVKELCGVTCVGSLSLHDHVLELEKGVVEPELLASGPVPGVRPVGEGEGVVFGVGGNGGEGGGSQDPGETLV